MTKILNGVVATIKIIALFIIKMIKGVFFFIAEIFKSAIIKSLSFIIALIIIFAFASSNISHANAPSGATDMEDYPDKENFKLDTSSPDSSCTQPQTWEETTSAPAIENSPNKENFKRGISSPDSSCTQSQTSAPIGVPAIVSVPDEDTDGEESEESCEDLDIDSAPSNTVPHCKDQRFIRNKGLLNGIKGYLCKQRKIDPQYLHLDLKRAVYCLNATKDDVVKDVFLAMNVTQIKSKSEAEQSAIFLTLHPAEGLSFTKCKDVVNMLCYSNKFDSKNFRIRFENRVESEKTHIFDDAFYLWGICKAKDIDESRPFEYRDQYCTYRGAPSWEFLDLKFFEVIPNEKALVWVYHCDNRETWLAKVFDDLFGSWTHRSPTKTEKKQKI
jgi:hypothetical protein